MSDLQIALAAIGVLVVATVYFHNFWQERKLRQRLERAFEGKHTDVLLDAFTGAQTRVEPRLGGDDDAGAEGRSDSATDSQRQAQDGADAVIEFIADIELAAAAGEMALRELLSRIATFGKPARLLGWDAADGWRVIGRDGQGDYRRLQAALQLVNRSGPVLAHQINGFCDALRAWAVLHGVEVVMDEAAQAVEAAQQLDAVCGEVDVAIGLNVVAQSGGAFPGEQIAAAAAAAGFVLDTDGLFHWRDVNGRTQFTIENHEPEGFAADRLATLQTPGLTLLLDVPRVAAGEVAFDRMAQAGRELAEALGGFVVDDNRVPLQDEGIARIRAQLQGIHAAMAAHGIPAGSERAQRLFE